MAKNKSVKEIITDLTSIGYKVSYYKRKDGGYLIKSINGKKYQGAKGNTAARNLLGEKLSVKKRHQLEKITKVRYDFRSLPKEIKKLYIAAEKEWNAKVNKGKYKKSTALKIINEEGLDVFKEKTIKNIKYAEGFANEKNVEMLIYFIEEIMQAAPKSQKPLFKELIQKIKSKKYNIKEVGIQEAREILYDIKNGATPANAANIEYIARVLGV